jgi:hypothetical protein
MVSPSGRDVYLGCAKSAETPFGCCADQKREALKTERYQLHKKPDAVVYDLDQFRDWMFCAQVADRCLYHVGQMLVDQEKRPDLKYLGDYASFMAELGAVRLVQARKAEGLYQYFASRTDVAANSLPSNLALGKVSVSLYRILSAIHQRQRRVSAAKSIRDAIICSDEEAKHILKELAEKKIVNMGKTRVQGPYLEKIGIEALK